MNDCNTSTIKKYERSFFYEHCVQCTIRERCMQSCATCSAVNEKWAVCGSAAQAKCGSASTVCSPMAAILPRAVVYSTNLKLSKRSTMPAYDRDKCVSDNTRYKSLLLKYMYTNDSARVQGVPKIRMTSKCVANLSAMDGISNIMFCTVISLVILRKI